MSGDGVPKGRAGSAPVLAATAAVSLQVGAGLAGRLFGVVPAAGMTGLRLWTAAALMVVLGGRGLRGLLAARPLRSAWRDWLVVAGFGVTLGLMN